MARTRKTSVPDSHDEQPVIHIDGDEQQGEDGTTMIQIRGSVAFMLRPPEQAG
jgi:hypothetical protein